MMMTLSMRKRCPQCLNVEKFTPKGLRVFVVDDNMFSFIGWIVATVYLSRKHVFGGGFEYSLQRVFLIEIVL